jgi:hypothetical protein
MARPIGRVLLSGLGRQWFCSDRKCWMLRPVPSSTVRRSRALRLAYLLWDLHDTIQFIREAGPGAVLSGIFLDPAAGIIVPNPPQAPHSLSATVADGQVPTLLWVDTSDNEAGFRIERGPTQPARSTNSRPLEEGVTSSIPTSSQVGLMSTFSPLECRALRNTLTYFCTTANAPADGRF